MENRIKIGGLWTGRTKSGEEFLSGTFGSMARLLVFKNNYKQGDKDPDFVVYVVPRERNTQPDGEASTGAGAAAPKTDPSPTRAAAPRSRPVDERW